MGEGGWGIGGVRTRASFLYERFIIVVGEVWARCGIVVVVVVGCGVVSAVSKLETWSLEVYSTTAIAYTRRTAKTGFCKACNSGRVHRFHLRLAGYAIGQVTGGCRGGGELTKCTTYHQEHLLLYRKYLPNNTINAAAIRILHSPQHRPRFSPNAPPPPPLTTTY